MFAVWLKFHKPQAQHIIALIEPHLGSKSSKTLSSLQRCKRLARIIKSQRAPPWPCPPISELPPKHLADELVRRYLQTCETVYRVLHVPSFKRDYESLWTTPDRLQANTAFLVQVKLVLALGAVTYDDQFSLQASAVKWVYEAQTYLSEPVFKSRLGIQMLQTRILLLLARELVDVGGDSTWISSGVIVRTAVTMGLHRDPSQLPKMPKLQAETRRRLWNTILELDLQASVWTGGPPLLSTSDFDTEPPGNFDDDVLLVEDAVPKSNDEPTDTSVAIALRNSYPVRLTVAKFLNDLNPNQSSYEETLRLDTVFRHVFKTMRQLLQRRASHSPTKSDFATKTVDFLILRYLSSLHAPYFSASLHDSAYAYSRKVLLETSLKMWCAVYPTSAIAGGSSPSGQTSRDGASSSSGGLFPRFVTCGAGSFRTGAFGAGFVVAAELCAQLREDHGLGLGGPPLSMRTDLFAVVDEVKAWCLRCGEAGETNAKGSSIMNLLAAHIEGLRKGVREEDMGRHLVGAANEAVERYIAILEKQVETVGTEQAGRGQEGDATSELRPDWDFPVRFLPLNFLPSLFFSSGESVRKRSD